MYEKESLTYRGMTISVVYDECPDSPATWDNPDCFLCSDYRDLEVNSESISPDECRRAIQGGKYFLNGFYIFPVCIYDHSGLALCLGEHHDWDYSNGWAFVCVRRRKKWSWEKAKAAKIAQGVLDEWNLYLSGQVFCVRAVDKDGDVIDSCCGYYGEEGIKDGVAEAKSIIDYRLKCQLKSHIAKRKAQIQSRVPVIYRAAFSL